MSPLIACDVGCVYMVTLPFPQNVIFGCTSASRRGQNVADFAALSFARLVASPTEFLHTQNLNRCDVIGPM